MIAATLAIFGAAYASDALACYIPPIPLPPEVVRQMDLDYQGDLWKRSSLVYVATVSRRARSRRDLPGTNWRLDEVTIVPAQAIRGAAPRSRLVLRNTGFTDCGPTPDWDVMDGQAGDRFVVFSSSNRPTQADILNAIRVDRVVHPALLTAMAATPP